MTNKCMILESCIIKVVLENSTVLRNHLISWGPIFVDCGFFYYSWGCTCNFMDESVFSFNRKSTPFINSFR